MPFPGHLYPAGQFVQEDAPASDHFFASQYEHTLDPSTAQVPAGHLVIVPSPGHLYPAVQYSVQDEAPALDHLPASQFLHVLEAS